MGVQLVPTPFEGPLPEDTVGLILGRASTMHHGLIVIPGIFNSDSPGKLQVMVQALQGTYVISPGDKIAQLLVLPSRHKMFPSRPVPREDRPPGSTGEIFAGLHLALDQRPLLTIRVQGKPFMGLLDTGADRSIIRLQEWPTAWPTCMAADTVRGIGQISSPMMSASSLHWSDDEGHKGEFTPYVLPVPVSLWGRDLLKQMDITLISGCSPQAGTIMRNMGYIPGKGLGKILQGRTEPIQATPKQDKHGLGFS